MEQGEVRDFLIDEIKPSTKKWTVEDLDKIDQIEASVKEVGLLHPISVESETNRILAGDKRYEVCRRLGLLVVKCLVIPKDLPPAKKKEIHIHENLFRFNLPWYEEVELKKTLHDMRIAQHGKGRQGAKVGWSLRDLADELKQGLGTLSQDLRLAEAIQANPNLRKLTDKTTAQRLIFAESRRQDAEAEASLPSRFMSDVVMLGDSAEVLKNVPDKTFDVVITDPPWLDYKDDDLRSDAQTLMVFRELARVLKSEAFLYAFVSTPDFIMYSQELPKLGFKMQQHPLLWVKKNSLSHGLRSWEYSRDYEPCILAVKGTPALAISGQPSSVFTYPILHHTRTIHPNEKPIELIEQILEQCTYEGSLVLDPFGGSGVVAEACKKLKRRYVIIERQKKYYDAIQQRLSGLSNDILATEDTPLQQE